MKLSSVLRIYKDCKFDRSHFRILLPIYSLNGKWRIKKIIVDQINRVCYYLESNENNECMKQKNVLIMNVF